MTKRPRDNLHSVGAVHAVRNNGKKNKAVNKGTHAYNARNSAGSSRSNNKALGTWLPDKKLVHVTAMKGNFWRICGFTSDQQDYLHPEEALYLCEKKQLIVHLSQGGVVCETPHLFSMVMKDISLPCYQAYIRLKQIDYICRRHSNKVRCFHEDKDVCDYLLAHPSSTLLDALVSYDIYAHTARFSKRFAGTTPPLSYVVITAGAFVFSVRVLLALLGEARGVPVVFAVLLPSGQVVLQEFTDALTSIAWKNIPKINSTAEIYDSHGGASDNSAEIDESHIGASDNSAEIDESHVGESDNRAEIDESHIGASDNSAEIDESHVGASNNSAEIDESHVGASDNSAEIDESHVGASDNSVEIDESHVGASNNRAEIDESLGRLLFSTNST